MGDPAMAEADEVVRRHPGAASVGGRDGGERGSRHGGVDEDDRDRRVTQPLRVAARHARRDDHDPIHAPIDEQVEMLQLAGRIVTSVGEHDAVAAPMGRRLDRTNQLRVERVRDVGHHQSQGQGLLALQGAGHAARAVGELPGGGEHPIPGLGPGGDAPRQHPADRGNGDAGACRHVVDRGSAGHGAAGPAARGIRPSASAPGRGSRRG